MSTSGTSTSPPDDVLVSARIVNEHVYCPRLAWLEWEAKAFTDNLETVEGRDLHRRVDEEQGTTPEATEGVVPVEPPPAGGAPRDPRSGPPSASGVDPLDELFPNPSAGPPSSDDLAVPPESRPPTLRPAPPDRSRTVTALALSSPRLGLTAKLDRVDFRDGEAIPVETKRGKPRRGGPVVWDPERAQLTAQALLLREQGYVVPHAEVFFAESRSRHEVALPEDADGWIAGLVAEVRANAARSTPPPPLVDSPKCPRCALVGVCLPDEVNLLRDRTQEKPRRLVARDDPRSPLYVLTPGAFLRQKGGRLELEHQGEKVASRRLLDVAHLAVFGNVTISSGAVRACMEQDTPILWFTFGGWFSGYAVPHGGSWVARRMAQTVLALDHARGPVAAAMIAGKLRNQRTLLRRLGGDGQRGTAAQLTELARTAEDEHDPVALLGLEGTGARIYFEGFPSLLKRHGDDFSFEGRNRRPPTDPVNAMLSFAYALLVRDTTVACLAAGLDPQVGLLHRPRHGRPSLALDLAEEFRPLIGDSTVITAINNGEVRPRDFVRRGGAVALTEAGRKRVIAAYERRVSVTVDHPLYGYRVSYRRAMELQARHLAAVIDGDLEAYRAMTTR